MTASCCIDFNQFLADKFDDERVIWLSRLFSALLENNTTDPDCISRVTISADDSVLQIQGEKSIEQQPFSDPERLAICLYKLFPRYDRYFPEALQELTDNYSFINETFLTHLEKEIYKQRKSREKLLKNCFIENEYYSVTKSWHRFLVIRKGMDEQELTELLKHPEKLIQEEDEHKELFATTISTLTLKSGKKLLVKRYNSKGRLYSLTRSLIESRARVCWKGAELFNWLGIPTPAPLAMIELKSGPWIHTSFLITEFVQGETLDRYLRDISNQETWSKIAKDTADIVYSFPQVRVAHGDFKATNFMVDDLKLVMIDLDSVRSYKLKRAFDSTYLRDIDRFERNWDKQPEAGTLYQPLVTQIRSLLK